MQNYQWIVADPNRPIVYTIGPFGILQLAIDLHRGALVPVKDNPIRETRILGFHVIPCPSASDECLLATVGDPGSVIVMNASSLELMNNVSIGMDKNQYAVFSYVDPLQHYLYVITTSTNSYHWGLSLVDLTQPSLPTVGYQVDVASGQTEGHIAAGRGVVLLTMKTSYKPFVYFTSMEVYDSQ